MVLQTALKRSTGLLDEPTGGLAPPGTVVDQVRIIQGQVEIQLPSPSADQPNAGTGKVKALIQKFVSKPLFSASIPTPVVTATGWPVVRAQVTVTPAKAKDSTFTARWAGRYSTLPPSQYNQPLAWNRELGFGRRRQEPRQIGGTEAKH